MHSSPPEGGDLRVIGRVRQVVETIGDRASGGRWEAVARLRLFCEGASLAEELEEIGSRKVSTMRTLVELLDELSPALGGDTAEARVLDDVVWILECLLCSVTTNHKLFLKQPKGVPLLLGVLARAPLALASRPACLESAASALCALTFHSARACQQALDAAGCEAIFVAASACLSAACPPSLPAPPPAACLVAPERERLACSLFELLTSLCYTLPQAQAACEAAGLLHLLVARGSAALRALPEPALRAEPPAGGPSASDVCACKAASSICLEQLLLALNGMVWCNQANQRLLCQSAEGLDALLEHVLGWYCWSTACPTRRSALPPCYLGCLLVLLGAQLDHEAVIGAVTRAAHERALPALAARHGGPLPRVCPLDSLLVLHGLLLDQLLDIRHNHQHAEVLTDALANARRLLRHCAEAHYLFVHMHGALSVELLLRCLANVDEGVLDGACATAAALLQDSRRTQALFLRKHGVSALRECALDYNANIQIKSLHLLALLAHAHPACRHELRDAGVLRALLRSVQAYPHGAQLQVLQPTLDLVAHALAENARNQAYVRQIGGLGALVEAICRLADAFCREKDGADGGDSADGADGAGGADGVAPPAADAAEGGGRGGEGREGALGSRRPAALSTPARSGRDAAAGGSDGASDADGADGADGADCRLEGAGPATPLLSPGTPGTPGSADGYAYNTLGGSMSLWPAQMRLPHRAPRAGDRFALPEEAGALAAGAGARAADAAVRRRRQARAPAKLTGARERAMLARASELACLCLNNALYKQPLSQAEALAHGVCAPCVRLVLAQPVSAVTAAALELLINLADTNPRAQAELGADARLLARVVSLVAAPLAPPPSGGAAAATDGAAAAAAGGQAALAAELLAERAAATRLRVSMVCCLFLSHLAWHNPRNQAALAAHGALVPGLLALVESARSLLGAEARGAGAGAAARRGSAGVQPAGASAADASSLPVLGAPAIPPALAAGALARAGGREASLELCSYALMALINLSYDCAAVQQTVGLAGGVQLLLLLLGCGAGPLAAAAACCLSNIVKGHAPNAQAAVRAGAARTLVALVSDDDEDELSNAAFVALVALGADGAADLCEALGAALDAVDADRERADVDGLERLLAVLNGLIYTQPRTAAAVLGARGLERLLGALAPRRRLPARVRTLGVHGLLNLTVSRDKGLQEQARALGAIGLVSDTLACALEQLDDEAEQGEACAACYFLLLNLLLNNAASAAEMVGGEGSERALELLVRHCTPPAARGAADPLAPARQPAAEVFLQLCDQPTSQPLMLQRGGVATLRLLGQSCMPTMVVQKALSLLAHPQLGAALRAEAR